MDQTRNIEEAQENQTRINIWLAISGNYDYYAAAFYVLRTELYSMPYLCTPIEDAPNDRGGLLRVFSQSVLILWSVIRGHHTYTTNAQGVQGNNLGVV